ncbi:MAG: hypothetical protein K2X69_02490, partial [Silvanigrellaceae bacterium]|nr:hypothetical protein [Silvanigrellaceae bacterium]
MDKIIRPVNNLYKTNRYFKLLKFFVFFILLYKFYKNRLTIYNKKIIQQKIRVSLAFKINSVKKLNFINRRIHLQFKKKLIHNLTFSSAFLLAIVGC